MIKFRYTILVVITIILFACTSDPEQTQEITPKKQKVKVDVPIFNADFSDLKIRYVIAHTDFEDSSRNIRDSMDIPFGVTTKIKNSIY